MIKIVHLITGLGSGGAEMTLFKLVTRMDRQRFTNVVVSMTDRGRLGDQLEEEGIPVETLRMRRGSPSPFALLSLRRILKRERPDILQTWLYHADLLGLIGARLANVPVVTWNIRCSTVDMRNYNRLAGATLRILSHLSAIPNAIVVNSRAGKTAHENLGYRSGRWKFIPNGFDLDVFRPSEQARLDLRRQLSLDQEVRLIGTVARFDVMKDYETLLRAAALVRKKQAIHWVLVGRNVDSSNETLSRWISELGLRETVHLLGERKDVAFLDAALDVFCSSSAYGEGMQNAVGEAMSCGVPCVVTDVGDAAWLVGETGRVVPPRHAEALATSLHEILAMPSEKYRELGLAARQRIEQHFSLSVATTSYEEFYEEMASR